MSIKELFHPDLIVGAFCGACKNNIPCENSVKATLEANGLEVNDTNMDALRGLNYHNYSYGMGDSFGYSDFGKKLKQLIKEQLQTPQQ